MSTNCFQLYVDDYTRESYLDLLDSKAETLTAWVELKGALETRNAPWKFAYVRTDSEFTYTSNAWIRHARDEGYEHEFSSRYRHDQMGVAERAMQTVGIAFRCMMIQGGAPEADSPYALVHANVVRNNSPTKANNGRTPKEKAAGMKLPPNKRLLKGPLFCLLFAHVYEEERMGQSKSTGRGVACVYLGYDDRNDQYQVKDWISGRVYYTGDGTFHPSTFPYRANPQRMESWLKEYDVLAPTTAVSVENLAPHCVPTGPRRSVRQHGYQFTGEVPVSDVPDVDVAPVPAVGNFYVHNFGPDPANWKEAMTSKYANEWIVANLAEKQSFADHDVLEYVPRAEAKATGKKIYWPRPVFKTKINPPNEFQHEATLDKHKFRLTIAAYAKSMTQGIDYEEKRASTVRWEAVLVLIAIAVKFDLDIALIDIKTFFLYGELNDTVFMEQFKPWETDEYPSKDWVCKLKRTMYGLPQAPCCAQEKLKAVLTSKAEFKPTTADDCVYVTTNSTDGYAALGAHVDDLVVIGDVAKTANTLKREFEIVEDLNPSNITGVQIVRDRANKWLKLHQAAYIEGVLVEFKMDDSKPTDTPMDPGTAKALMALPAPEEVDDGIVKRFQQLVGSLIWLYKTRPDMLFTINLLSRFLKCATAEHLRLASGRPLRYLKGTLHWGIVFQPGTGQWRLSGAGDADLAGDIRTARSTSGNCSKLGEFGSIACHSTLERKISTSTGQAETYALASLIKDVVWIRHLLADLRHPQDGPTKVATDNQGVERQSTKPINHATAKHYRIDQAYIRQKGDDDTVDVVKVGGEDNPSDMFTKALHAPLFFKHRHAVMGPQGPPAAC